MPGAVIGGASGDTKQGRGGARWAALAALQVALAAVAIALDLLLPTLIILVLAWASVRLRRDGWSTLGLQRPTEIRRMALPVLGAVAVWTILQLGLFMPVLNRLTGEKQDLSAFEDLQGNLGLLLLLLAVTWTLAAVGEELAYRGFLQTRATEAFDGRRFAVIGGVLVSAALFGLAHTEQGLIGVVLTGLDAVFFSVLKLSYGGNLWAAVLAHGFSNSIGLTAFFIAGPIYGLW